MKEVWKMVDKNQRLNAMMYIIRKNPDISDKALERAIDASLDGREIANKTGLSSKKQDAITAEMEKELL